MRICRSFMKTQYSDKPPSDEEILGLLGTHVEAFISLSAHVNRAYLNALFRQEVVCTRSPVPLSRRQCAHA
jgi:hypothetical protein